MWGNSKPQDYLSFRVFIFGITSQSMFPNGVIYDGVLDNKPLNFRGESGANDSMVRKHSQPLLPYDDKTNDFRSLFWTISVKSPCRQPLSPRSSMNSVPTVHCLTGSSSPTSTPKPKKSMCAVSSSRTERQLFCT